MKPKKSSETISRGNDFPIVGVGASAGGLEAFTELLKNLPTDTGLGFVIIQHLDPHHESALTGLLRRVVKMPIREAAHNLRVEANHVYVIPPNVQMTIQGRVLKLGPRHDKRAALRTIDVFLESLAADLHERALGVILSGTATDGTQGLEAVKAEGGITFAQDDSAKYDSMPRSAVATGCVDFVLTPEGIAKELARIAAHPSYRPSQNISQAEGMRQTATKHQFDKTPLPPGGKGAPPIGAKHAPIKAIDPHDAMRREEELYKRILMLLRNRSGVDFSLYKSSTIQRRILRRTVLNRQNTLAEYAALLKCNAAELDSLYSDVLISVTNFFRNPEVFETLKRVVFPKLAEQRGRDDTVRVWVLGCSTGQEAYSIAMTFAEFTDNVPRVPKIQIFATDLNEALLEKARAGLYAKSLVQDISPERLRRFFVEEETGYRVNKSLREEVVFARQNLLSDPPFSRMDLVSCRNVLIYLEPVLQSRIMPAFHYALKPGGFLMLGAGESVGPYSDLFEPIDKRQKIFTKKTVSGSLQRVLLPNPHPAPQTSVASGVRSRQPLSKLQLFQQSRSELDASREADRVSVGRFVPPGVLISSDNQILQFRGSTGAFLEPPSGKASLDVLKLAREGLLLPLRAAINKAKKEGVTVRRKHIRVGQDGRSSPVNLEVIPLKNLKEPCFLILFELIPGKNKATLATPEEAPKRLTKQQESKRLAALKRELADTRDYLQAVEEQYESANEELQAASEEAQSTNEELQSLNEELETSKEELESTNEELTTVNEEMANRNVELSRTNSDLNNLNASLRLPILVLGCDLTVRRFTSQAEKVFNLMPHDVGRPLSGIRHTLEFPALERMVREVIDSISPRECEIRDNSGRWYQLRVRPYMTVDNKLDGAVLVLIDISVLKTTVDANYYIQAVLDQAPPLLILDDTLHVRSSNRAFYMHFKVTPEQTEGRFIYELGNGQWNIPELRRLFEEILPLKTKIRDYEVIHVFESIGLRTLRLNASRLDHLHCIFLIFEDITKEKKALELAAAHQNQETFIAMLAHELRNPLAPIRIGANVIRMANSGNETINKAQAMIARQANHLTRLVEDLLDTARLRQHKIRLHREQVDLANLITSAIDDLRPSAEAQQHTLTLDLPQDITLDADPARVEQIVKNLVQNAIKYTPPKGKIQVTSTRAGDFALISVRDNGIGIEKEMLQRIFETFTQVDQSSNRSQGGLGLGLKLVKELAELHGGSVEAHSEGLEKGAEFVVRLPLWKKSDSKVLPRPPESPVAVSRNVLVIDDNADIVECMQIMLGMLGHRVTTAMDGKQGLECALQGDFDLILVDISMPGLDGYELARRFRSEPRNGHKVKTVLAAMTGFGRAEDRRRALEAGFNEHMTKPVDVPALTELLNNLEQYR